jgi:hypothetical protein
LPAEQAFFSLEHSFFSVAHSFFSAQQAFFLLTEQAFLSVQPAFSFTQQAFLQSASHAFFAFSAGAAVQPHEAQASAKVGANSVRTATADA